MPTRHANTDLVAGLWLASLPGLNAGMVGTTVPEKAEANASLVTSGCVEYFTVGGTPDMYVPERQPVLQIKTYGFPLKTGSRRPQRALANDLAEAIVAACQSPSNFNAKLTLPNDRFPARVQQAHALQEPRPVPDDRGYWSVFQFDLQIYWVELPS